MIKRNCFGKLEPVINNYFVKKDCKGYRIMKKEPYYITDAKLYNECFLWQDIEPFDSLVKAYKYMKENIDNFL